MKALHILIKLHKRQLDNLLISINALESKKNQLTISLQNFEAQAQKERAADLGSEYAFMLSRYLAVISNHQKQLTGQIAQVSYQIDLLRNQLQDKFAELKKLEIVQQNRLSHQRLCRNKAETKFLDELNTVKFVLAKNASS